MHLEPYLSINGLAFSASRVEVVERHGDPQCEQRNAIGLTELDYGDIVFRFQDCGRLEEVSQRTPVLWLAQLGIPFVHLAGFVRTGDAFAFERAGFLVSPLYGLAFVPAEPVWLTALACHCLPEWAEIALD